MSRHVPWVTLALVGLNLLASFLGALDRQVILEFSFDPNSPSALFALTSLFLHANTLHLLGNLVFLAAVGPRVEEVAGWWKFLLVYLAGGFVGVAAHWAVMRAIGGGLPLLGASGSIAAVAGYAAVRFMRSRVPLAPRLRVTVGTVTMIWVGLQGVGAFVRLGDPGGAAFWTHLAGFLVGLLLSLALGAPAEARRQHDDRVLDEMRDRSPAASLMAAQNVLIHRPGDARALRQMAEAYRDMGEVTEAAEAWARLVEAADGDDQLEALKGLSRAGALTILPTARRMKLSSDWADQEPDLSVRIMESVLDDEEDPEARADAVLALAQLSTGDDQARWLDDLRRDYPLSHAHDMAVRKGLIP
ncbi:MAG: rhomboid family intramembrane serine protease [Fimbriimonadaceae bacterium]|nr:rhomboid family intramembrane serine protease [Fimbriimonadaceae bacterium]QYK58189.1 MAG: rhomboid family intramembrane serine protease [Fimbriimonadaceae bacterium]